MACRSILLALTAALCQPVASLHVPTVAAASRSAGPGSRSHLRSRVARAPRLYIPSVEQIPLKAQVPATDAVLRFGHYSCCLLAGTSGRMSCLVAGDWLYAGRMMLTGAMVALAASGFNKATCPRRWSRVLKAFSSTRATKLLTDAGAHAVMLLYLPLESMRWLTEVAPGLSPSPALALHGPITQAVGALWLCWLLFRASGLLVHRLLRHEQPVGQPSTAKLVLDATLATNWIAPSLSLWQVGLVGTLSSALGLHEITMKSPTA